jgi:tetratricopeptide (TPR) repeat protein
MRSDGRGPDVVELHDWSNSVDLVLSIRSTTSTLSGRNVFERAGHEGAGPGLVNAVGEARRNRATLRRTAPEQDLRLVEQQNAIGLRSASLARAGSLAWEAFLRPPIESTFRQVLAAADAANRAVRLGIEVGEFGWVPWEALRDPASEEPLALRSGVAIYRVSGGTAPPVLPGPLRILVAIAAPNAHGTAVLNYEHELLNLEAAISAARGTAARLSTVNFATTDALRAVLDEEPVHVLHITGHGTPGAVVLEDLTGRPRLIGAEELVSEAFPEGGMPSVVSLAACFTGASVADGGISFADKLIELGVPAVVATETSVTDIYATDFFAALYRFLARSIVPDLVHAVAYARRQTHLLVTASRSARQARVADLDEWSVVTVKSPSPRFDVYDTSGITDPTSSSGSRGLLSANEFIGRRAEQRALVEMLDHPDCGGIFIQGIGGVGKSALLSQLLRFQLPNRPHVMVNATGNVNDFMVAIGNGIRRWHEDMQRTDATAEAVAALSDTMLDESRPLVDRIETLYQPAVQNIPQVVAIDSNERVLEDSDEVSDLSQLIATTMATNPKWRFIFTGRTGSTLPADVRQRLMWLSLGPLSRAESLKLIRSFDQLAQLTDVALDRIWSVVGGHPRSFQILNDLMADRSRAEGSPDGSNAITPVLSLDHALERTLELAADEVGFQHILRQLNSFEALLLLRMSVYRKPVDFTGLVYQTGDIRLDASVRHAAEPLTQISEILRRHGVDLSDHLDFTALSAEARSEVAPFAAELITALIPPVTPSVNAQDAVRKLLDLSLIAQDTVNEQFVVNRAVADAAIRMHSATPELVRDAHQRAAEYWLWRARAASFEFVGLLQRLTEAHHHFLRAGDIDSAISVADTICDRLHQIGDRDAESWYVNSALILLRNQPERQGFWLHRRGNLAYQRGDLDAAEADYNRAADIHLANGDDARLASQYGQLAIIARDRGDELEAKRLFEKCLALDERHENNPGIARTLGHLGSIALAAGNVEEARSHLERSLSLREAENDYVGIAASCYQLGVLAQTENELGTARTYLERCLDIRRRLGLMVAMSDLLSQLGVLARQENDLSRASDWFREAYEVADRLNDGPALAAVLHQQALLAYEQDDLGEAARLFEESLAQVVRDPSHALRARFILGHIAATHGDLEQAVAQFLQVIEDLDESSQSLQIADAEIQLARIARRQSDPRGALVWFARAAGRQLETDAERLMTETLEALVELRLELGVNVFHDAVASTLQPQLQEELLHRLSQHEAARVARSRSLAERLAAQTGSRLRERLLGLFESSERDSSTGHLANAITTLREAVSVVRAIVMQEGGIAVFVLAEALRDLATLMWNRDRAMESVQIASEAAYLFGSIPATAFDDDPFEIDAAQARSQWTLGIILAEVARDYEKGLDVTEKAVAMLRVANEQGVRKREELAIALHNLGTRLLEANKSDDALATFHECLELTEDLVSSGYEHYSGRLASCLVNLATLYARRGMVAEAQTAADRAVTIRRHEAAGVGSEERLRDLARSLYVSALAQISAGERITARARLEEAVEVFQAAVSSNPAIGVELEVARFQLEAVDAGVEFNIPIDGDARPPDTTLRSLDPLLARCPSELVPTLNKVESALESIRNGHVDTAMTLFDEVEHEITSAGADPNLQLDVARSELMQTLAAHLVNVNDRSAAALLGQRALELVRVHSADWDAVKPIHAALALTLATHHDQMAETTEALSLAAEAVDTLRRLTENPHPHHRFQHLPALVASTVALGELNARAGNFERAVEILTEAVGMSRESLYDRRYLDDWSSTMQMHVHGLLWLTTAFEGQGGYWAAVETSNDAVRIARELSIRDAYQGTSVLAQALSRHSRLAAQVGRGAEAQASAQEAIEYLGSHAAEFNLHARLAVAGDAHLALGLARVVDDGGAVDDREAALLHLLRAADEYRSLIDLTPHPFPLVTLLDLRVMIGNLLVPNEHRLRNAEVLTELIETHGAKLGGEMPPRVHELLRDILSSDEAAWSAELKSRVEQLLQRF